MHYPKRNCRAFRALESVLLLEPMIIRRQANCVLEIVIFCIVRTTVYRAIDTLSNLKRSPSPSAVKLMVENESSDTIPKKLM